MADGSIDSLKSCSSFSKEYEVLINKLELLKLPSTLSTETEIMQISISTDSAVNESSLLDQISGNDEVFELKKQPEKTPDESFLLDQLSKTNDGINQKMQTENINAHNESYLLDQISITDNGFKHKIQTENIHDESLPLDRMSDIDEVFSQKLQRENTPKESSLSNENLKQKKETENALDESLKQKKETENALDESLKEKMETGNESILSDQILETDEDLKQKMQNKNARNESLSDLITETSEVLKQDMQVENALNESSLLDQISDNDEVFKQNSQSSTPPRVYRRSSLWKLFDPLHTMTETKKKVCDENFSDHLVDATEKKILFEQYEEDSFNASLNKGDSNDPGAGTLISFESPKKLDKPLIPKTLFPSNSESFKKYTEEEFQKILKTEEARLRKEMSDKHSAYKMQFTEHDIKQELMLLNLIKMNKTYHFVCTEIARIADHISEDNKKSEMKLKNLAFEKEKLKVDIKTSKEDLSNIETAFSGFHKPYEQCKEMIKNYKENEEHFNKSIERMQVSLDEQGNLNSMLESRSHEILDKGKVEIEATKKSYEAQMTILEAQVKKAQMKVYSLESDLKQVKSENEKLSDISDELMSKISI